LAKQGIAIRDGESLNLNQLLKSKSEDSNKLKLYSGKKRLQKRLNDLAVLNCHKPILEYLDQFKIEEILI